MACVATTNFDYPIALSLARCCPADEWEESCSKQASHSSCAAAASSCSAAFASSSMPLTLPDKISWGDWVDDRSTDAAALSPRSDLSDCDEPAEKELADNEPVEYELVDQGEHPVKRRLWSDLVDSSEDDEADRYEAALGCQDDEIGRPRAASGPRAWADMVERPRALSGSHTWADLVDSEDEADKAETTKLAGHLESGEDQGGRSSCTASSAPTEMADASEHCQGRSSRASRRTRAARAAAADACRSTPVEDDAAWQPVAQPAASKATSGKGISKGAAKGADQGPGKGAVNGVGKGAHKGAGKSDGKGSSKGTSKGVQYGSSKGAGKGSSKGASKGSAKGAAQKGSSKGNNEKYQCQMVIGIEEDSKFRVVRRMIGSGGENMKNINQKSDAKLRLRGRGSKFLEGDTQMESTDDLMLCISSQDKAGFETAKAMASELIEGIHHSYRAFCHKAGKECPSLELRINDGYREGSR